MSLHLPFSYRRRFMPQTATQNDWSMGVVRDVPPHEIPMNAAYTINDFLIDEHGQLYQRGPFTNFSSLTGYGGANVPRGVYLAQYPLSSNAELVLVPAANGNLYRATSSTSTSLGAFFSSTAHGSWAFYIDKTIVCPGSVGAAAAPKKITFDGTTATLAALGGSPPSMNHITMYKSRLCGGGDISGSHPNRLYFSPVPAIDGTWDTTNAWIDCEHNIKGLVGLRNMLLIWSDNALERIIGDTPPPGSNMDRTTISNIGMYGMGGDTAIAVWNDNAIYGNTTGVWMTNGGPPVDLTSLGGIKKLWESLNLTSSNTVSLGVYRNTLMVSTSAATNPGILCFDLLRKCWYLMGGLSTSTLPVVTQFSNGTLNGTDELVFVDGTWGYSPVETSTTFLPTTANYAEASNSRGVGVQPWVVTRTFTGNGLVNRKRWTFSRMTHDLTDPGSNNPTWTVTPSVGMEASRALTAATIAETSATTRSRVQLFAESQGYRLDIKATTKNLASSAKIYAVEIEAVDLPADLEGNA